MFAIEKAPPRKRTTPQASFACTSSQRKSELRSGESLLLPEYEEKGFFGKQNIKITIAIAGVVSLGLLKKMQKKKKEKISKKVE